MKKRVLAVISLAMLGAPALSQTPSAVPPIYGQPISLTDAMALINLGIEHGAAEGLRLSIAVVEPSGELVAFARMDNVSYATIQVAQKKARTAARFRMPTASFQTRVQNGELFLLASDEVLAVGGGVPIVVGDKVIGALGISGASAAEDAALAEAVAAERKSRSINPAPKSKAEGSPR